MNDKNGGSPPFSEYLKYLDGVLYWSKSRSNVKTGSVAGRVSNGYISIKLNGKEYQAHRIVWEMHKGKIPSGLVVDHINHNRTDNRIGNLRLVTKKENSKNRSKPSNSRSGVVGVRWYAPRGKYRAEIMVNRKTIFLGYFCTIIDAKAERLRAERRFKFHENHGN